MIVQRLAPRIGRALVFARHIPADKLLRRLELRVRCAYQDRFPALASRNAAPAAPPLNPSPPSPLFQPRRSLAPQPAAGGRNFTFLNRSVLIPSGNFNWHAPSRGSADQLWRMNLHYLEFLEGVAAPEWSGLVASWIADNPEGQSGAWRDAWNSYALSLRVAVWLQELQRRGDEISPELRQQTEASAAQQLRFLARNLETDIGGNHLIKNIKALLWGSAYFAGPEARAWRATGLALLTRELLLQVPEDGLHYERSASYHAQVFADLLECRHALGSDPFGGRLEAALDRMAQALTDLTQPDGLPVLFNDAGLSMAYTPGECLEVYRRFTGRAPAARSVFALKDAGYYGLRTAESYFVADCGRIAPDDLPAHGHGDVLAFEWSIGRQRIVVDQGVYEYNAGERRDRARSAASHNTLCLDGADQADFFGAFRCGRRPNVTVRSYTPRPGGFALTGSHDGFRHLPGAPVHVRSFDAGPRRIAIVDRIEGATLRPARIGFLLHPDAAVTLEGPHSAHIRAGSVAARLTASAPLAIEDAVWWPDMGREVATTRLVVRLAPGERLAETQLEIL